MLITGQTYMLGVKDIVPAADFFSPRDGGATRYCHYFTLVDEHNESYPFQICDERDIQNYCSVGDTIKVKVKTYTKGRYTTETIIVVSAEKPVSKTPEPSLTFASPSPDAFDGQRSKQAPVAQMPAAVFPAAHTNAAVALECAVKFYSNVPVSNVNKPSDSILLLAEDFYKFLQSHK